MAAFFVTGINAKIRLHFSRKVRNLKEAILNSEGDV
jgi:hypothetical protein